MEFLECSKIIRTPPIQKLGFDVWVSPAGIRHLLVGPGLGELQGKGLLTRVS